MPPILAQLVDLLPDVKFFYTAAAAPAVGFLIMWVARRANPPRYAWGLMLGYYAITGLYMTDFRLPGPIGALLGACFMLLAGPVLGLSFVFAGLAAGRVSRIRFPLCPRCAYDLTGNVSGVCPECGERIPPGWRARLRAEDRAGEKKVSSR